MKRVDPVRLLRRAAITVCAAAFGCLVAAGRASARPTRPRFEPTDLELEDPGVAELDTQIGVTRGDPPQGDRLILPDFEVDLGLLPNVELDVDGAFDVDRFDDRSASWNAEPLWTAVKLGLSDLRDPDGRAFATGLQLGPRLPTIGMRGIGYAALGLVGLGTRRVHTVLNVGGILDPEDAVARYRPESFVAGLDLDYDLDAAGAWSFIGELSFAHYLSPDPDELATSAGLAFDPSGRLEVSLVAIGSALPGADRLALLLGVSPKLSLW